MSDKKYKVGSDVYDIPEAEASNFLKDFPNAIELETFIVDKDTFDIPVNEIDGFLTDFPKAKSLKKKDVSEVSGAPSGISSLEPLPSTLKTPDLTLETPELGIREEIPDYLELGKDIPRPEPEKAQTAGEAIGATLGEFGRAFSEMFGDFGKLGTKIQDSFASIFLDPKQLSEFKKARDADAFVPQGGITLRPAQRLSNLLAQAVVDTKELPGGVIGDVTRGMIHITPDLILAAGAPELLLPKVFGKIGLKKLGKFGFEQGMRGMIEGMDQTETAPWNLQLSIPLLTSFERGITGWMYEGMGHSANLMGNKIINKLMPNAKTIGESINKSLLQKGTTALTNGLYFMGYGGLDEFVRTGQVSKENLSSSFGMGFAFSMPEMGNLLYAKGINSFIAAPREGINNIYKSDVSAKELSKKSEELAKSIDEGKSENPEADAVTAFMLNKASQLKAVVDEVKENPKEVIKSIDESTLEPKAKELIIDKVHEVVADNDPKVQEAKPYTDDIALLDDALDKIKGNKAWSEGRKEVESAPLKRKREELKKKELEVYGIKEPEPKEGEGEKKKELPLTKEDKAKIDEVLKKEEITKVEEETKDAETIGEEIKETGHPQELVEGEEGGLRLGDIEKDRLAAEQREEVALIEIVPETSKSYSTVAYHGTDKEFEAFDLSLTEAKDRRIIPNVAWFSDHKAGVKAFAESYRGKNVRVIESNISFDNPLVVDARDVVQKDLYFKLPDGRIVYDIDYIKERYIDKAREGGYDGVIFLNARDANMSGTIFVVFNKEQITPQEPAPFTERAQVPEVEQVIEPEQLKEEARLLAKFGVKFKNKTYIDIGQVQDDFADGKITFQEQKTLLEDVRKFEEGLINESRTVSDNIDKDIGDIAKNAEETLQKEITDKKSKLYLKFFPDIITPISNSFYKPLVKVKDALSDAIAGELKKGVKTQNDGLRWTTKVLTNLYNGLLRTHEDMFGKEGDIGIGKLEMTGTTRSYAQYKAKNILSAWRDAVNSDSEALKRIWQVLDPELGTKAGERQLTEADLSPTEKNLYNTLRKWNTWVWSTNYANGLIPTKSHLKFKGDFEKTGYADYIARMYDKFKESTILSPEIRQFVNRGNSSVTSKMITDYMKLRKDLGGVIEIDGKLFETIEELKRGLKDGDITKDQYDEFKDQIKSKEWRQEHAIKDPAYLTAKRVMQTIQNVGIKKYMDMIINQHPDYVLDIKKGGEMPKGYTKFGASYSWGPFRNKAIIDHVAEDFVGFFYKNAIVNTIYDGIKILDRSGLNRFYKQFRTVLNPFVQAGNISGNVFFASVNGINPARFVAEMLATRKMSEKNPALYESLLKSGLIGDVAMTGEMRNLGQPISEKTTLKKMISWPAEFYTGADNFAKIAAYRIFRKDGFTHRQAIRRTYDAFQNYSTVGKTWDLTSKLPFIGPTFVKFQADLQRIMVNNLLTAPLTTIGTIMLIKTLGHLASTMSGETDEEREIREKRTGVPKIPIANIPLSFKVGKSELNVARYITPLFIYPQGDNQMDINELSKFMPLQFQKKEKDNLFPLPAFADATWGWLGSVLADRDFRMMSIQDPYSRRYNDVGITTDERLRNVLEFSARSQLPFYKGTTDIIAGATGQLDYYGRNRNWKQAILNNIIKIQEFDKPELKYYMEHRIDYLTNRYTTLATRAGNANRQLLKEVKTAEDKGLSKEAITEIYEQQSKIRDKRLQKSLDEQIPILDEIERLTNVYKKWEPESQFIQDNFDNIESGKLQRFKVLNEKDFMSKYKDEYRLLKENHLLIYPDIPNYYNKTKLTDDMKKMYMESYWSEYLRGLESLIGLTQEEFDEFKEKVVSVSKKPLRTKLTPEIRTRLDEQASKARENARNAAEMQLMKEIQRTKQETK